MRNRAELRPRKTPAMSPHLRAPTSQQKGPFDFPIRRTDPRFYFKDPLDLYTALAATAKKIDPQLP
jgi:hypothetical protein